MTNQSVTCNKRLTYYSHIIACVSTYLMKLIESIYATSIVPQTAMYMNARNKTKHD
jgi:hypothetical protein